MAVSTDGTRAGWDETQRKDRLAARQVAAEIDADSPEAVLELARQLAERLARVRVNDRHTDAMRLARAMALNVVDLLEGSHRP